VMSNNNSGTREGGLEDQDPNLARLVAAHPKLFRGTGPDIPSHVSPGWYDLIDRLCSDIEEVAGPDISRVRIRQVKEKFGTLRFYWALDGAGDTHIDLISERGVQPLVDQVQEPDGELRKRIRELLDACEGASAETCERCGKPGRLGSDGGWWRTRCPEHSKGDE